MTSLYPPFTIGVDLGGTNTVCAIVDSVGHIIIRDSFPTATSTIEEWADTLATKAFEMINSTHLEDQIIGMGIGAPCANAITGSIEAATDLPWPSPIPIGTMMQARLRMPVTVTNDANAAAIGEMMYGAAAGMKNFIVLTLGTGVGAGVVCDGHLLSGTRGFAGELGHVTFPFAAGRPCGCGRTGCLQTVASAKGILTTTRHLLDVSSEQSSLRNIPDDRLTAKLVCEAARQGDSIAKEIYTYTGHCLGLAAAEFAAFTDPEAIILFGGVANAGDLLLEPMAEAFREHALHLYRDRVRFLVSGLNGADAAILGAASLPHLSN